MTESFGFIRHGEKLGTGEKRKPLSESGLTADQQEKWTAIVDQLGGVDPEVAYAAVPKIEKLAHELYESLPDTALVVFASTHIPRARFTADLLATEITRLVAEGDKKEIATAFVWEPSDIAERPDSISNISMWPPEIIPALQAVHAMDDADDESLAEYMQDEVGSTYHPKEDEMVFKAVNADLASPDSFMRRRAELLKKQSADVETAFAGDRPVYFYGVGHHSSLIALDVAFNGRAHYDSVDDMPKPLSLWKANAEKS